MSGSDAIVKLFDLVRHCDENVLLDARKFVDKFPEADISDYMKAFESLINGKKVDKLIKKFSEYQFKAGQEIAEEEGKSVFRMLDMKEKMLYDLHHGKEKGSSTYISKLDNGWTWKLGEFNIWTGYVNEGKSLFLRFISLIKIIMDGWKFAFYAPEDYPAHEFFDDFIHTASGFSTDKDNHNFIQESLYIDLLNQLDPYIFFVYVKPPKNTLIQVFKEFIPLIENEGVKVAIIDPLIKLARPKQFINADDKYAGYATTLATDFARHYNISLHLVMHQLTPRLQENGLYPEPSYYNIKGGGTWADGSDNVNSIQRPYYARDKVDDEVKFKSMKIKKQKLVGIPQEIKFRFNRYTNRYVDYDTKRDLFNFEEKLKVKRMRFLFAENQM